MIRNRPQGADIIDIVIKEKRAFVGYPPVYENKWAQENNFRDVMFDISNSNEDDWQAFKENWSLQNKKKMEICTH